MTKHEGESVEDYIGKIFAEGERRAAVLADVNKLTDAYRLKVLIEAVEHQRKKMAKRGSAVHLCTGGDPDHDDAS